MLSLDLDKRAQVRQGGALGFPKGVRPLNTYERFSSETSTYEPAEIGGLRLAVRREIAYGRAEVWRAGKHTIRATINAAGGCTAPAVRHMRGVWLPMSHRVFETRGGRAAPLSQAPGMRAYLVSVARRCRKCENCGIARKLRWADKARAEYERAARTWHLTFTLNPFQHAWIDACIGDLRGMTAQELFRAREKQTGVEISRWLDRIRVSSRRRRWRWTDAVLPEAVRPFAANKLAPPPRFRYLVVAEEHRSERTSPEMVGRPHYHMLVHELGLHQLVLPGEIYRTKSGDLRIDDRALLKQEWKLGHLTGKLCADDRQAAYLCKYLDAAPGFRVRASLGYGEEKPDHLPVPAEGRVASVNMIRKGDAVGADV